MKPPTPSNSSQLLTERLAAAQLSISVGLLRKLRRTNQPPTYLKLGHAIRYRMSDLEEWVRLHERRGIDGTANTLETLRSRGASAISITRRAGKPEVTR
jgi:hypothetical protein